MKVFLPIIAFAASTMFAKSPSDTTRVDFAVLPDTAKSLPATTPPATSPEKAVAEEAPATRRLYLHPILTGLSILSGEMVILPVTYERSFAPGRSFALQPTVMFGSLSATDDNPPMDVFQATAISQLRFYLNGKVPKRIYVAPALALGYLSNESEGNSKYASGYARGMVAGIAGFVGWTFDEGMLPCDLNFGVGIQKVFGESRNVRNFDGARPLLDLNLGLGFRL